MSSANILIWLHQPTLHVLNLIFQAHGARFPGPVFSH